MLLTALECFRYKGTRYLPGDTCNIESDSAKALMAQKLAVVMIEDAEVVYVRKHSDEPAAVVTSEVAPLVIQNSLDLLDGMTPAIAEKCARAGIVGVEQIREMNASDLSMKLKVAKAVAQRLVSSAINDFSDGE